MSSERQPISMPSSINGGENFIKDVMPTATMAEVIKIVELMSNLKDSDKVVIQMGGPLGDTTVQTAQLRGLLNIIDYLDKKVSISVCVDADKQKLLEPYEKIHKNLQVIGVSNTSDATNNLIQDARDSGKSIFIFDTRDKKNSPSGTKLRIDKEYNEGKNTTIVRVSNVFKAALFSYEDSGFDRVGIFMKGLFNLPANSFSDRKARPHIPIIGSREELREIFNEELGIDYNTVQITILPEAGIAEKRYPLLYWFKAFRKTLSYLAEHNFDKNITLNIIYNQDAHPEMITPLRLFSLAFLGSGIKGKVNFLSGPIENIAKFLATQDIVDTNDTGFNHIAAGLTFYDDNGNELRDQETPEVVGVYLNSHLMEDWTLNEKQRGMAPDVLTYRGIKEVEPELVALYNLQAMLRRGLLNYFS